MNLNEKKGQRSKLARSIACFECTLNFVARQLSRLQKRKADSESAFSIYWKIINNNPFYFEHFTFSGRFSTWPIRCMTHIIWLISFGVFVNGAKGEYWRGNALMRCKNSVVENREGLYGKSLRGQTINVRIKNVDSSHVLILIIWRSGIIIIIFFILFLLVFWIRRWLWMFVWRRTRRWTRRRWRTSQT